MNGTSVKPENESNSKFEWDDGEKKGNSKFDSNWKQLMELGDSETWK